MVALFLALSSSPEALWTTAFEEVCERIGPCFARSETRERAKAYLRGLLSPVERKNGWQLAEEARETTPYAMQYLLNRAVWDSNEVRDQLQAYVRKMIGDTNGIVVLGRLQRLSYVWSALRKANWLLKWVEGLHFAPQTSTSAAFLIGVNKTIS
jgi:DDE superfamily endonuclease